MGGGRTRKSQVTIHEVALEVAGERFVFDVQHKPEDLGGVGIRQLWMDKRTLYDWRPPRARNARSVVGAFWALCRRDGDGRDPGSQESYLLANLLPFSLTNVARKVVPDGAFGSARLAAYRSVERDAIAALERGLQDSAGRALGIVDFARRTADVLDVPVLTEAEQAKYRDLEADLLRAAGRIMVDDPPEAVRIMTERWQQFEASWGRRRDRDHPVEKRVLALLSYECRAALRSARHSAALATRAQWASSARASA